MTIRTLTYALMFGIALLSGCEKNDPTPPQYVTVPSAAAGAGSVSSKHLVDPSAQNDALLGDGYKALVIGVQLEELEQIAEAKYWLRISAENGSGVGMQHYAFLTKDEDCVRAIFWLKRAIDSGDLDSNSVRASKKDLSEYRKSCLTQTAAK